MLKYFMRDPDNEDTLFGKLDHWHEVTPAMLNWMRFKWFCIGWFAANSLIWGFAWLAG